MDIWNTRDERMWNETPYIDWQEKENSLIREHSATLNIVMPGNNVIDYEDERKQ